MGWTEGNSASLGRRLAGDVLTHGEEAAITQTLKKADACEDPHKYVDDLFKKIDSPKHARDGKGGLVFYTKLERLISDEASEIAGKWNKKVAEIQYNNNAFVNEFDRRQSSYSWIVKGKETLEGNVNYTKRAIYKLWFYSFLFDRSEFKEGSFVFPKQRKREGIEYFESKTITEDMCDESSSDCSGPPPMALTL